MRHKSKKFKFPGSGITLEEKEIYGKSLKDYKTELQAAKALMNEKSRLRKRGKIESDVSKCKVPEEGALLGGMRYDRKLKKVKKV
jgi:hypothetical protein